VTTHLDADTILSLILALRGYDGALLVVTHDRFFMRSVVEGENPYSLANLPGGEGLEDEEDDEESEGDSVRKPGVVYRLFRGQLRLLENGVRQYEDMATRAAAKLAKSRAL
jgi:ATP-binding cassette, subfamily F, member 3